MILRDRLIKKVFNEKNIANKKKVEILKLIKGDPNISLNKLADKINISMPLASYHLHGNLRTMGLIELELLKKNWNERQTDYTLDLTSDGLIVLEVLEK